MANITQRENGKWQSKIRRRGWPDQSKTFQTKAAAEAWTRAVEREMDIGAFVKRDDAERTTFSEAAARYVREVLPEKRGRVSDESRLRLLVERFGKYSLASISPAMLSAFRDELLKTLSAQSAVHYIGLVSRIFKACAMDWDIALPNGNPATLVRKPRLANSRQRRLEANEETLLFAALAECKSPWPHAAVVLALETAGRQSELLSLTWKEVDLVRRTARLRGVDGRVTKSGDEYRDVPLSSRAIELLTGLPRTAKPKVVPINQKKPPSQPKARVLPITQNALQLSFERALARGRQSHLHGLLRASLSAEGMNDKAIDTEIRALIYKKKKSHQRTVELLADLDKNDQTLVNFTFHDLRHECTSRLASKLQMHELMKVTGHKTAGMMSRYYHPRAEDLALKLG